MFLKLLILYVSFSGILSELFHGPLHPIKHILRSKMDSTPEEAFKVWHYLHKRQYKIDSEEGKLRFENFKNNFHIIKNHNSKTENSYSLGLNNFADMTLGEFHKKFLFNNKIFFHKNLNSITKIQINQEDSLYNLKDKVQVEPRIESKEKFFSLFWNSPDSEDDFNEQDFIKNSKDFYSQKLSNLMFLESPLKGSLERKTQKNFTTYRSINWIIQSALNQYVEEQGECGSCWAFSAVQSIQAAYSIKTGNSQKFSKQQLVDCDSQSDACNGGFPHFAMDYIKKNGLLKEEEYPYKIDMTEDYKKSCEYEKIKAQNKNPQEILRIKDFEYCIEKQGCKNDLSLFDMLQRGPLSAVVDASEEFMLYENGIYDKSCSETNHAILIAGYHKGENENESSYWIVKNSWGFLWGDHGFIKIKHSKDYNSCLLNQYYLRPIL